MCVAASIGLTSGQRLNCQGVECASVPVVLAGPYRDFMQVFSTLYLLQLPGRQQQAVAVSAWGGTSATAGCMDPSQQQQVPGSSLMSDMQAAASPDSPQAIVQLGQQSDSRELGTDGQGQHKQQLMQNTVCQQVPAQCMAWAGRPQFKLMVAHSCEVVLGLGQANHELLAQVGADCSMHD